MSENESNLINCPKCLTQYTASSKLPKLKSASLLLALPACHMKYWNGQYMEPRTRRMKQQLYDP